MRRIRIIASVVAVATVVAVGTLGGTSRATPTGRFTYQYEPGRPPLSGVADDRLLTQGGGRQPTGPARVGSLQASDDIQVNGDNKADPSQQFGGGEGWPANETVIAVNPTDESNVIAGANDYESGVDSVQGNYASFDGGHTWTYSRHARQVLTPDRRMLGSGDPVVAFDSEGTAYQSFISFGRADCDSYIATIRSTDGGITWSTPADTVPAGSELLLGDGITVHNGGPADCQIFHDKEWMTTGVRPPGATIVEGSVQEFVGPDRVYVTWTRFDFGPAGDTYVESPIYEAHSDDQGRTWSEPQEISGASPLCEFNFGDQDAPACDEDQFSVPVVDPNTGRVYVIFENFQTSQPAIWNQYLVVQSDDGGETWSPPTFVTRIADGFTKYPICFGSQTLDQMCARVNAAGNIDVDPNTGALYVTWSDNRNGSASNTNTDVFVRRSTDGGSTWTPPKNLTGRSADDQFFPWLSVAPGGTVAVVYFDRRYNGPKLIDTTLEQSTNAGQTFSAERVSEVSWNPDLAFRLGFFIGDYNGLDTSSTTALPFWTDARFAEPNVPGNNPPHQQSDVMVDVEPLLGS
jgi:hypothetical protein